jgi:type IV secretion system protein VirB6
MVCWITTVVLLVVVEPSLVALARSREAGVVDTDTATLAAALIFIFAAAQAALSIAVGVIAGGFRISSPRPARASAAAGQGRQEVVVAPSPSRADRLAQQLQTGLLQTRPSVSIVSLSGDRSVQTSATAPAAQGLARLGTDYRRDAFLDRFRPTDRSAG